MRKQKFLVVLMAMMIAIAIMPTNVFAWSGSGTSASPYLISTEADMRQVRNYPDAHFKLTADIALTTEWTPIGNEDAPFKGVFNGNGHTISGMSVDVSGSNVYAGLFGYSEGEIKNLTVKADYINVEAEENAYVAAIVGFSNRGTISNCYAEAEITVSAETRLNTSNVYVGVIAGKATGAIISAKAYGSILAEAVATSSERTSSSPIQIYAGGIVGFADKSLENVYSVVDIDAVSSSSTIYSSAEVKAGGIVGESSGGISKAFAAGDIFAETASDSTEAAVYAGGIAGKNTGDVAETIAFSEIAVDASASGSVIYSGGLIGHNAGDISDSFANGSVNTQTSSVVDSAYAGGLIGLNSGKITSCYATGLAKNSVSGLAMNGGLVGYTSKAAENSYYKTNAEYTAQQDCGTAKSSEELKSSATYSGWDFSTVWTISADANNGYPTLRFMPESNLSFVNAEHTYDKTQKSIVATNIGSGVTVIYRNNKAIKVGTYEAIAIENRTDNTFAFKTAELKINKKTISVANIVALDKEVDGTTEAEIDISAATLEGVIAGDDVVLNTSNAAATFASAEAGDEITVTVTGLEITGKDIANYELAPYTTKAAIIADYNDIEFEGSGTEADPYLVATENQLNAIRVNSDKHFKLQNDIVLLRKFIPIQVFSGSLDGDEYTISGLKLTSSDVEDIGLIRKNTGTIKNLTVSTNSFDIKSVDTTYIGVIAGINEGTISRVKALGNIQTDALGSFVYIGGITGKNAGTVSKSVSEVNVTAEGTNVYAGGAIGENKGAVEKTYATGNVVINDALMAYAGGFVGVSDNLISNCYATGDATINVNDVCFMLNAGGFAGRVDGGTISQSYSIGTPEYVVADSGHTLETAVGGFVAVNSGTITNCFYNEETSGQTDIGKGEPKTSAELKDKNTYSSWNFADWNINATTNSGYPFIRQGKYSFDATLAYNNGTVTISANANISNAYLIIASYFEGALVDYDLIPEITISKGGTDTKTVKANFEVITGGTVKAMLWIDLASVNPLATFVSVEVE